MPNENLSKYMKSQPDVNPLELVHLTHWVSDYELIRAQLVGVTHAYLHDNDVVHGDLKSVCGVKPTTLLGWRFPPAEHPHRCGWKSPSF